ncbi:MAG: hypothetical protein KatS3mg109_0619 [Pirellulaceae bacterium]|nr:MAG: hypothetical protein KatS3mg109_0619 [Pirellulaceae bacterium]
MARHRHWDEGDDEFRTEDIDFGDDEPGDQVDDEQYDQELREDSGEESAEGAEQDQEQIAEGAEPAPSRKGRRRSTGRSSNRKSNSGSSSSRRTRKTSSTRRKKSEDDEEDRTERLEIEAAAEPDEDSAPEYEEPEPVETEAVGTDESDEGADEVLAEAEETVHAGATEPKDCVDLPPDNNDQIQALRKLGCRVDLDAHGHVWRIFLYERNKDNALAMIHDFPCLKEVWLFGARVSAPMVEKFRELHPHVNVYI